ncbi:hypothetical protein [Thermogemmata fonticola]|jgi:predicted small lipoprotein YifL|uniref:Lipoprotein n=1 Tax=Thermogemmata fonticola TaxID=2755323 RepID=A0A7V9ACS6_9BACT|nr:hypothetical protein [Thermogemmata fonticola]MBA2227616.1 hypothetical protein [Thermogemmata fonticola]
MKMIIQCVTVVFLVVLLGGCGSKQPALNTQPLTEEQKAAVRAEDAAIDEEESPGNRTRAMTKGKR